MKVDRNHWEGHLAALAASDLSIAEYCRRHGLRYGQLNAWKARLARQGPKTKLSSPAFVRAKASTVAVRPQVAPFGARLVIGSSAAIEFPASADPSWVAALALAIGGHSL
jgi:hypothetical protein